MKIVGWSVWLSLLDQYSLSYLLIKLVSNALLGESSLCVCLSAVNLRPAQPEGSRMRPLVLSVFA